MSDPTRSPGDIVEARCTRCRTVTNHTIIALVETRIARVQCNTCGGMHNYHPPKATPAPRAARSKPAPAARPGRAKATAKGAAEADSALWLERCSAVDPGQGLPYAMDRSFPADSLVNHPTFGLGLVLALHPPGKVEILFREGRKLLRCG